MRGKLEFPFRSRVRSDLKFKGEEPINSHSFHCIQSTIGVQPLVRMLLEHGAVDGGDSGFSYGIMPDPVSSLNLELCLVIISIQFIFIILNFYTDFNL